MGRFLSEVTSFGGIFNTENKSECLTLVKMNLLAHCFKYLMVFCSIFYFLGRLRSQRKAVVTTVDKKIPNGILEEQGDIVVYCAM